MLLFDDFYGTLNAASGLSWTKAQDSRNRTRDIKLNCCHKADPISSAVFRIASGQEHCSGKYALYLSIFPVNMTLTRAYSETKWSETLPNASKLYVLKQCNYPPVILRFRRFQEWGSPVKMVQINMNQSWIEFERWLDIAEEIAMKRWNEKNGTRCYYAGPFGLWASSDNSKGKKLMELPTEVRENILRFCISEDGKHMSPHFEKFYGLDREESEKYIWEKQFDSGDGSTGQNPR